MTYEKRKFNKAVSYFPIFDCARHSKVTNEMSKKPPVKGKGAPTGEPKAIDPLEYIRKVIVCFKLVKYITVFWFCIHVEIGPKRC